MATRGAGRARNGAEFCVLQPDVREACVRAGRWAFKGSASPGRVGPAGGGGLLRWHNILSARPQ